MKQIHFYLNNTLMLMILMLIMILMSVAFLTLMERKVLSYIHYRKGPNKVSFWGIPQPFSDAMKLMLKEFFLPYKSNYLYFMISPMLMFIVIMMNWLIYPFYTNLLNWNMNTLFFLCLLSLSVYSFMVSGWSSNSSFSMIGSIRSIAQSVSYEVLFSITFLITLMMINSLNFSIMLKYQKYMYMIILMWPTSLILLISMTAEINRTPFDLSEGESELVSGFNIEYGGGKFTLIFLSEYASILFMMFLFNVMYLSKNLFMISFYMTFIFLLFFIIWMRATLPRIRYDYLMNFCWIHLLPFILVFMLFFMINIKMPLEIFNMNLND